MSSLTLQIEALTGAGRGRRIEMTDIDYKALLREKNRLLQHHISLRGVRPGQEESAMDDFGLEGRLRDRKHRAAYIAGLERKLADQPDLALWHRQARLRSAQTLEDEAGKMHNKESE